MRMRNLTMVGVIITFLFVGGLWYVLRSQIKPAVLPSENEIARDIKQERLACIAELPLKVKLGQKIMAAGYNVELANETVAFSSNDIGGIIIMNETPQESLAIFRKALTIPPLIAVDQEGGSVQRYKNWGNLPGAEEMALTTTDNAYQLYLDDYKHLREHGFTTNFAPVVDVNSHTPSPLPGRMYSGDPEVVANYAKASIDAAHDAGLTPVIKHFPGLGSATGNTDFAIASTDPLSVLESRDLIPYKKLVALQPDVMVGNMIVPELTNGQPAIWSSEAIMLLRSLGYEDAVIYSDSLTAEAVPGTVEEAAVKSWTAGIDIALFVQNDNETLGLSNYFQKIIQSGITAVGSDAISTDAINKSVYRIFERKDIDPCSLKWSE